MTTSGTPSSAASDSAATPSGSPLWAWITSMGRPSAALRAASARPKASNGAAWRAAISGTSDPSRAPHVRITGSRATDTPGALSRDPALHAVGIRERARPGRFSVGRACRALVLIASNLDRFERRDDRIGTRRPQGEDMVMDERAATGRVVGRVAARDDEDPPGHRAARRPYSSSRPTDSCSQL